MIFRRFADLPGRQIHYREHGASSGVPLMLFHASPGSSKQLEALMSAFSVSRRVIAPDRAGNGDSPALDKATPEIADYAADTVLLLDALKIPQVDVFGSHTGASIAGELAIIAPGRVRKVVLDGIPLYSPERRDEYLREYARPYPPDLDGSYLQKVFMFCRDQYLFSPWYKRTSEHRRANGIPSVQGLHNWVLEVLKAPVSYVLGYQAAFRYPAKERIPKITQPVLAMAPDDDSLKDNTRTLADACANFTFAAMSRSDAPDHLKSVAARVEAFLGRA